MRQVVLVVVMVGAAFLGGAFVNGPGLRWVQTQLLGSMGMDEGGEIATVDLKGVAGAEKAGPVAPVPGLVPDPAAKARAPEGRSDRREGPEAPRPMASNATAPPRPLPDLPAPAAGPARAPRDPDLTRVATTSATSPPTSPTLLDSQAPPMPAPSPGPPEGPAPAPTPAPVPLPSPAPERPGDEDWATLARKMQTLGVSRFTIEGQPGGRVIFSCLIPLAGRQAVTQRFEADGEDAVQAARAALRRVALWRAAQPQSPPSTPR